MKPKDSGSYCRLFSVYLANIYIHGCHARLSIKGILIIEGKLRAGTCLPLRFAMGNVICKSWRLKIGCVSVDPLRLHFLMVLDSILVDFACQIFENLIEGMLAVWYLLVYAETCD